MPPELQSLVRGDLKAGFMNLIKKIGDHTIARLQGAASERLAEAEALAGLGRRMTAIYLCGYAAESLIGAAYFRLQDLSMNDIISEDRVYNYLKAARQFKQVSDQAHPLDGESRLLIVECRRARSPGYPAPLAREIVTRVDSICCHWSHKLRYRAIDATKSQVTEVLRSSRWLFEHREEF